MLTTAWYTTLVTSVLIRAAAFVFLRWIPGHHFPPLIWTSFALYLPAFIYTFLHTNPFTVISDTVAVTTREVVDLKDATDIDPRYADPTQDPGQELVVEEEIELEKKDPQLLVSLFTGLPSPSSLLGSIASLLINIAIVAMVTDLVYRAPLLHPANDLTLARVGYVSDTTAKILIREPDTAQLPLFLSYRQAEFEPGTILASSVDNAWKSGGRLDWLDERSDFTATFTVTGLRADTRYEYVVSNNETGKFTTAPRVGKVSGHIENGNQFTFVHSSCVKLNFPYSPFAHPLSAKGFRYLNSALEGIKAQFMLFLGDFIYADVPRQLGLTAEDYRLQYRQVYGSPDWQTAAERVPSWIHVYDDHEISNDWSANETQPFHSAFDAYEHYHTSVNPDPVRKGVSYFSFTQGPATFFMLDTRRYRSSNKAKDEIDETTGEPRKTMLGTQQRDDLLAWLKRPEPAGVRWKVVVSSVPFTKNWKITDDTWAGFLTERELILEAMWDVGARSGVGVIILSGDRHEFAATSFPPPPNGKEEIVGLGGSLGILAANPIGAAQAALGLTPEGKKNAAATSPLTKRKTWPISATVHEFSASPLNMFYLPVRTYAESSVSRDYVSDVCIKYIPDGNHKFGAVSISNPATSEQSILQYRLFVDGVEAWSYTLTAPPLRGGHGKDAIWG